MSTPAKIAAARHLLPASAQLIEIPGADHAQFGDDGLQSGDGVATATDGAVRSTITLDVSAFIAAHAEPARACVHRSVSPAPRAP